MGARQRALLAQPTVYKFLSTYRLLRGLESFAPAASMESSCGSTSNQTRTVRSTKQTNTCGGTIVNMRCASSVSWRKRFWCGKVWRWFWDPRQILRFRRNFDASPACKTRPILGDNLGSIWSAISHGQRKSTRISRTMASASASYFPSWVPPHLDSASEKSADRQNGSPQIRACRKQSHFFLRRDRTHTSDWGRLAAKPRNIRTNKQPRPL